MKKNVILFVNAIRPATFAALDRHKQLTGQEFDLVVFVDEKIQDSIHSRNGQKKLNQEVKIISADFDSAFSVRKALKPYEGRILAVTCQYENSIYELRKLVPYFPYLSMPTEKSLEWANEKKLMREMLESYDTNLVPKYVEVGDDHEAAIQQIEDTMSYPMIVKPSGLEGSLLVSLVNNTEELHWTLDHTRREIQKAYDTWVKRQRPRILVEEFMDGDMYSVDTYVGADGTCYHTPPVKVITGRKIGFDDFFGYARIAPAGMDEAESDGALEAAGKACHALGLRAVTVHIELMRLPEGWKIIELGARSGGYRHDIYSATFNINHIVNDILIRAGQEPIIPTEVISPTAVLNIYAREEGILTGVHGLHEIEKLHSFISCRQIAQIGEPVLFAKNNGDIVFEFMLSHEDLSQVEADMQKIDELLQLDVAHEDTAVLLAQTDSPD